MTLKLRDIFSTSTNLLKIKIMKKIKVTNEKKNKNNMSWRRHPLSVDDDDASTKQLSQSTNTNPALSADTSFSTSALTIGMLLSLSNKNFEVKVVHSEATSPSTTVQQEYDFEEALVLESPVVKHNNNGDNGDADDRSVDPFLGLICSTIHKEITDEAVSCRRKINGVLQSMDKKLRLSESDGICLVQFAPNCDDCTAGDHPWVVAIEVPAHGQSIFFYTVVRRLNNNNNSDGRKNEAALLRYALELNYMEQETRGGCLSLDGDELTLNYAHPVCGMDQGELENILGNLYETLNVVSAKLDDKFPLK